MHRNYSESFRTKSLENLPLLINTQHYSLFQIAICHLWRQMTLIKEVFHSASYTVITVDHSLSGITAWKFIAIDCACKSCDPDRTCMCYTIARLAAQSWHWNAILRMCNTILRLCKFSDFVEHIQVPIVYISSYSWRSTKLWKPHKCVSPKLLAMLETLSYFKGRLLILALNKARKVFILCSGVLYRYSSTV